MEEGALGARGSRPELSEEDVNVLKDHLRRQKAVFKQQVSLLDQGRVSVERVRAAVRRFQPSDLDDLAEERKLIGLCGYPLCGKAPTTKVPNVRVVDVTRRRIVDAEQARRFCSMDCLHRLELIKVQVPANSPDSRIEIPLMDGSSDKEVATEEANAQATQQSAQAVASVVSSNAPIVERQVDPNAQSESFPAAGSRVSTHAVEGYRSVPEDKAARAALAEKIKAKKEAGSSAVDASTPASSATPCADQTAAQIVEQLRELGIHEDDDFASAARVATKAAPSRGGMESGPSESRESRESEKPVVVEEQQNEEDKDESEIEESINRMNEMNESEDEDVDEEEAKGEVESGSKNVSGEDAADDEVDFAPGMDLFDVSTLSEDIAGFEFTPLMRYTDVFNAWTSPRAASLDVGTDEPDPITQSRAQVLHTNLSKACGVIANAVPSGKYYRSACQQALVARSATFNLARPVEAFSSSEWQVLAATMLHALVPTAEGLDPKLLTPLRTFATGAERGKAALDGAEFDSFASYVRMGFAEISAALAMAPPQPPSGPLTTISESA